MALICVPRSGICHDPQVTVECAVRPLDSSGSRNLRAAKCLPVNEVGEFFPVQNLPRSMNASIDIFCG
jgi:hypothetical protein